MSGVGMKLVEWNGKVTLGWRPQWMKSKMEIQLSEAFDHKHGRRGWKGFNVAEVVGVRKLLLTLAVHKGVVKPLANVSRSNCFTLYVISFWIILQLKKFSFSSFFVKVLPSESFESRTLWGISYSTLILLSLLGFFFWCPHPLYVLKTI